MYIMIVWWSQWLQRTESKEETQSILDSSIKSSNFSDTSFLGEIENQKKNTLAFADRVLMLERFDSSDKQI